MIRNILILGGGSAGFIAAITLKSQLPHLNVTVLRSPEIGIIGVGEGTTASAPSHLHGYIGIDLAEFYREVNPSWKLGIKFIWGPRPYFNYTFGSQLDSQYQVLSRSTGYYYGKGDWPDLNVNSALMTADRAFVRQQNGVPYIGQDVAYHLENETFVTYLEKYARRLGVSIREGTVAHVERNERGVTSLKLGGDETIAADFFVDCSGFRSVLLGETLGEPYLDFKRTLYCDSAVVGGWDRTDEPIKPYTLSETMTNGWSWQIEHETRINRGYVFSSSFISDEAAEREFRAANPKVEKTRFVRFKTGRYARAWVDNVAAIGNSCGFVEPLEATAIGVICADSQALTETLRDTECDPTPSQITEYNVRNRRNWENIRCFLGVHYKFNTRLDNEFWRQCRAEIDISEAERIVAYYRDNGPSCLWRDTLIEPQDQFQLDGYWVMLVGQALGFSRKVTISSDEQEKTALIERKLRETASRAYSVKETLELIRSPQWTWQKDFYREALKQQSAFVPK